MHYQSINNDGIVGINTNKLTGRRTNLDRVIQYKPIQMIMLQLIKCRIKSIGNLKQTSNLIILIEEVFWDKLKGKS